MSDPVKHECGIALIRLLKPLSYYIEKYGTPLYGLKKLYLLMEKQHNRGQDGAGISNIKLDVDPGQQYIFRKRSVDPSPIADIFNHVQDYFRDAYEKFPDQFSDAEWLKNHVPYSGELMLGHLRYSTHSKSGLQFCHPLIKQNNWMSRNLVIAGNFNMTNNDELFNNLVQIGQHPRAKNDTVTVLEKFGHFLDEENERLYRKFREAGYSKKAISPLIIQNLSVKNVLQNSSEDLDG
ncbi:MAG: amidophosphoribosyltransferase, partial [Bacteroidetes bacterium SW_10_40_5]